MMICANRYNMNNLLVVAFLVLVPLAIGQQGDLAGNEDDSAEDSFMISVNEPIKLTQSVFTRALNKPHVGLFVMFASAWCGHCKRMASTWSELSKKHNKDGKYLFAKVDCTDQTELCSDNDVLAYPTFMFFKKGSNDGIYYNGERDMESIEEFMISARFDDETKKDSRPVDENRIVQSVYELDDSNFRDFVAQGFHFVKFFAPWCSHCKNLAPIWDELGKKYLDSSVKISRVDCTKSNSLCTTIGIRGYPTLIFFHNGNQIESYQNRRNIELLSSFVDNLVDSLSVKSTESQVKETAGSEEEKGGTDSAVVAELTRETFSQFLEKAEYSFVKFYAPWCSHCKQMAEAWHDLGERMASSHDHRVHVGMVDCTNNAELCLNHNINAYPTLVLFRNAAKVTEYTGARDLDSLHSFLASYLAHDDL